MKMILVADPDPATGRLLEEHLRFAGVEILPLTPSQDALQTALDCRPDLVVADAGPPDWTGFRLAQYLREKAPEIPVLLVSTSPEAWVHETARALHVRALVSKPVSPQNLMPLVQALLGQPLLTSAAPEGTAGVPLTAVAPALLPDPTFRTSPRAQGPTPPEPVVAPLRPSPTPDPATAPALPAAQIAAPPAAGHAAPPAAPTATSQPTRTGRVLIVEDDRTIAKALAVRLRAAGLEVLMAYDALSGLDIALRQQPDLVLLDIGLPAGSGLKVAERIQNLLPKLTPIIFLTASRQPGLREQALKLDPVDYIEKPYDADKLLESVQRALVGRV